MNPFAAHPAIASLIAYWGFSAIVGGMPEPDENSSRGYQWAYNSLHILAGNLTKAISARYPQINPTEGK